MNIDNPSYIRPSNLVELSFTLRSVTLGQIQTKEIFLTKLDAVLVVDKFGAKVCPFFSVNATSNSEGVFLASVWLPMSGRWSSAGWSFSYWRINGRLCAKEILCYFLSQTYWLCWSNLRRRIQRIGWSWQKFWSRAEEIRSSQWKFCYGCLSVLLHKFLIFMSLSFTTAFHFMSKFSAVVKRVGLPTLLLFFLSYSDSGIVTMSPLLKLYVSNSLQAAWNSSSLECSVCRTHSCLVSHVTPPK